jgi:GLPGLI family protein
MKACLKTFILNFDKSFNLQEEEKLEGPGQGGGMRWMSSMTGGGGNLYKMKKNCMLLIRNLWGVLVKDSLVNYQWKLEGETRVIGGYNCFKATTRDS